MALITGSPRPPSFPSGRYTHTNPLRREAGLRLLTESLPEALRWAIIRAWRRPSRFDETMPNVPNLHRQRPSEAQVVQARPHLLSFIALTEMEVSRRVVEAPLASISRAGRVPAPAAPGRLGAPQQPRIRLSPRRQPYGQGRLRGLGTRILACGSRSLQPRPSVARRRRA